MKKVKLLGGLLAMVMLLTNCKKVTEKVIDCFGEAIETSLHVTVNATNSKQVTTEVKYWGNKTITKVKWEFGDGITVVTTGLTSHHTYTVAGTYTVKARVTLAKGTSSCEVDPTRAVHIQ